MKLTNNQTRHCEDYPTRGRSSIRCGMTGTTGNRSRTCGSAREGAKVAHGENRAEQSEERAHGSWRTHAGTGAIGAKDDEDNRCWVGGAIADTGSWSKSHESEESTSCCAGTSRQGRQVKVLDFVR